MRKHILLLWSLILTAGLVGVISAQEPAPEGEIAKESPKNLRAERVFAAIDADSDGTISKEEFQNHVEKMATQRASRGGGFGPQGDFRRGGPGMAGRPAMAGQGQGTMQRGFGPPMAQHNFGPPMMQRGGFGPQGDFRRGFDGDRQGPRFDDRGPRDGFRQDNFRGPGPNAFPRIGGPQTPKRDVPPTSSVPAE
jgi:hypothetical protein